jgi:peptide chain release factor subunit 1
LRRLTTISTKEHRVVTCYLKLEPRDRSRGKYQIKLKNRVRQIQDGLDELQISRGVREEVRGDLDRILEYLRDPGNLPASQAVAVFASEPLKLFEAVPLPWVHRSRLAVDRTPLVRELAAIEDEFGRMLTVVSDRTGARMFEVTAFDITELEGLRADHTRGKRFRGEKQGFFGISEHDYHSRIREEKHRHFAQVSQRLLVLQQRQPYTGIVLAGPGADAGAVEPFLHPYVAERLMGIVRLNPKDLELSDVRAATLEVRREHEREQERALADEMEESLGEWAVNGMADTLRALSRGQVRTLLVSADAGQPGARCNNTGRLTLAPMECGDEGGGTPVLDVVDEAIEEALRQRVIVNVIYDEAAAKKVDGLAGLLRFR